MFGCTRDEQNECNHNKIYEHIENNRINYGNIKIQEQWNTEEVVEYIKEYSSEYLRIMCTEGHEHIDYIIKNTPTNIFRIKNLARSDAKIAAYQDLKIIKNLKQQNH